MNDTFNFKTKVFIRLKEKELIKINFKVKLYIKINKEWVDFNEYRVYYNKSGVYIKLKE